MAVFFLQGLVKGQVAGRHFHHGMEAGRYQGLAVFDLAGKEGYWCSFCVLKYTERGFSHKGLGIGAAFSGNDEAGTMSHFGEVAQVQYLLYAGNPAGAKISHKGSSQAAGRPCPGKVGHVHCGFFPDEGRPPDHAFLQHLHVFRRGSFLRRKHPRGAVGAHKGSVHVAKE